MRLLRTAETALSMQVTIFVGLLLVSMGAVCKDTQSYYVPLQAESCRVPSEPVRHRYVSRDLGAVECRVWAKVQSAPSGLYVVSSNEHSWIDFVLSDKVWSSEDEVVYEKENQFGNFPNVSNAPAEIRTDRAGVAIGLIFRVTAQASDYHSLNPGASNVSRLFVLGFRKQGVCFLGLARDNIAARKLLDSGAICRRLLKAERLR
ncbi:MAG: hypothetical protein HOO93_18440 [Methyloglobulus sp.]|nr:hypothetical protein [Methyloglobulus sp.]